MNKTAAKDWLSKAYHDLSAADILFGVNHYTDTIGADLQQALEKIFKAFLAYQNKPIPKTHELLELAHLCNELFAFNEDELELLVVATGYYTKARYPMPYKSLPARDQVETILKFTHDLLRQICLALEINKEEIQ